MHNEPMQILEDCWKKIKEGIRSRKSNYHTMSLHYSSDKTPRSIMMIPRRIDLEQHILYCHTDNRSPKVIHLKKNPSVSLLFWCREKRTQIQIQSKCQILHNTEENKKTWDTMQNMSKVCYASDIKPGTECVELCSGFSEEQWENRNDISKTAYAYNNFAILKLHILQVERLFLNAGGHNKIVFIKDFTKKNEQWTHRWKAP
ncbi:MAG: pyridoxamine 5'-phosphate oxidase family protein [Pseudomonadota bacterium]|nr:pyridoxamine 5'-phosphate oxidase family protein [Pseudomonadota bacterium]